jgi:hypothetical protein
MITQALVKQLFAYDNGNLIRLQASGGNLSNSIAGWTTVCNGVSYRKVNVDKKTYYVHRIIYLWHHGHMPKVIDHINNNSLDNRIENLREATQSQNCANQRLNKNNKSGAKGVTHNAKSKKYIARVMVNRKNIWLGSYYSIEDAINAYKVGSEKYFGEFARSEQASKRLGVKTTE